MFIIDIEKYLHGGTDEESKGMEIAYLYSESGDMMMKMFFGEDIGYAMWKIGEEAYMELATPVMTKDEGDVVPASHSYFKTTGMEDYPPTEDDLSIAPEEITSLVDGDAEIVSIKYLETKDFHGTQCDVVQVVVKQAVKNEEGEEFDSERQDADQCGQPAEQEIQQHRI